MGFFDSIASAAGGMIGGAANAMTGGLAGALMGGVGNLAGGQSAQMQQQTQMMADMQQQNMQNLLFQQQVTQQALQFSTLSNAQKAQHDAIMAMLNPCPNQALVMATTTKAIAQTEQGVKAGTASLSQLNALVSTKQLLTPGGQQNATLQAVQQQNLQNLMFQQQVNNESQKFTTLSNAQKASHDAIMAMLNNAK